MCKCHLILGFFKSIAISSILQSLTFPPVSGSTRNSPFFHGLLRSIPWISSGIESIFSSPKGIKDLYSFDTPWPGPNAVTLGTKYMCFFKQCILFVFLRSYLPNKGQVNLAMGEPSTLGASEQGVFMSLHFIWDAPSTTRSGSDKWFIQWFKIPSPAVQQNLHKNYAWSLR